jgi:hypothetical protein
MGEDNRIGPLAPDLASLCGCDAGARFPRSTAGRQTLLQDIDSGFQLKGCSFASFVFAFVFKMIIVFSFVNFQV